jgi:hypothetical protein
MLVVLTACKSEGIGKIFKDLGIKHVICIKQDQEVLDKACLLFTKELYSCLYEGSTICDSSKSA